jgi:hypothetical protein
MAAVAIPGIVNVGEVLEQGAQAGTQIEAETAAAVVVVAEAEVEVEILLMKAMLWEVLLEVVLVAWVLTTATATRSP